ncbi:unnamed protein product, partial [Musa hybrid cultivar]
WRWPRARVGPYADRSHTPASSLSSPLFLLSLLPVHLQFLSIGVRIRPLPLRRAAFIKIFVGECNHFCCGFVLFLNDWSKRLHMY